MSNFPQLIASIESLHNQLQAAAANAVNKSLTIRNWLIGYYIVEFEQKGNDRAEYGKGLLNKISKQINLKGLTAPELSRCRQFYMVYPQILGTVSQEFNSNNLSKNALQIPPEKLIENLAFSHLSELLKIDNSLKRIFYEIECIKGTWSVRELKRQINSLYFERSGLSQNPEKLAELVQQKTKPQTAIDIIKNVYAFDFLDISTNSIIEESDLETGLLDHLQQFILELGHGFCFEARQKRILIGENYYFIDLLFYHRILKCHVLVELKIGEFTHGDIGQLNTYLNYFRKNSAEKSDSPAIGILLVAEKDQALVEYATAGMDENLFIQKYMLQLPETKILQTYLENELDKFTNPHPQK
jgi:predicted nuclease of restriction endonuclease-like (RecB) superfamily